MKIETIVLIICAIMAATGLGLGLTYFFLQKQDGFQTAASITGEWSLILVLVAMVKTKTLPQGILVISILLLVISQMMWGAAMHKIKSVSTVAHPASIDK